jgi:cysteine desulfurase
MRGGTENLYGIIGLAKALEIAHRDMEEHRRYIMGLKSHMIRLLSEKISNVRFTGDISDESLYTVLNVSFAASAAGDMLLFNLDISGIAASGGSACSSGTDIGSHVLSAMGVEKDRSNVRFSFSRFNTFEEIEFTVSKLQEFVQPVAAA